MFTYRNFAGSVTTTVGWASTPVQPSHSGAGDRLATVYSGTSHTASPEREFKNVHLR
jgi:hypothetical protein